MELTDFSPNLELDGQRIAVDRDTRRVAVRVARWDEVHSGFGEQVRMPRKVNVDAAHVGVAELDDGSKVRVATLPMETMHAPRNLAALHAAAWYENSGKGFARVRYSVDDEGIRADGLLFADIEDAAIDRALAASASGDWRSAIAIKRFSDFEKVPADFVGSCIVNVPGFSDTFSTGAGTKFALAASAHTLISIEDATSPLTAASIGIGTDGLSDQDVRDAWRAKHSTGLDQPYDESWVEEFYAVPAKIIGRVGEKVVEVAWSVDSSGLIAFGDEIEVEHLWVPKGITMQAGSNGGDGCNGDCADCGCGKKKDKSPTVALSASAIEALMGDDEGAKAAAREEALSALVAGGLADAPDPAAARLDRMESMLTSLVFNQDD